LDFGKDRRSDLEPEMKLAVALLAVLLASPANAESPKTGRPAEDGPAFAFAGTDYFFRFTMDVSREYTPKGQDDLEKWTDMVTVIEFRTVTDGEGLADAAKLVIAKYREGKGKIIRSYLVPETKDRPAEYFAAVLFNEPNSSEVAFARFKLHEGIGASVVYSHRFYGKETGHDAAGWLKQNGKSTEKNLLEWNSFPKLRK
jgi:hypothetical protein